METYFRLKLIFEYIVPFAILGICVLPWICLFVSVVINSWKEKRRKKREDGTVRKKDDAV